MTTTRRWLLRQWVNHPILDVVAAMVCIGVLLCLRSQVSLVRGLAPDTRRALYQTAATLSGTLLGLVLTSISILNTLLRADLEQLTEGRMKPRTQRRAGSLFFSAVRALGVALLVYLALLILDTKPGPPPTAARLGGQLAQALALAIALLLVSRVSRVVWVLSRLLHVSAGAPDVGPVRTAIDEVGEAPA